MLLEVPYVANDPTASRIPIPGPGRDAIWQDPTDLYAAGLEYFQRKEAIGERYTVAGLALGLGLSYQSLNEYGRKPAFSATVHALKSVILEQAEKALFDKDTVNGAKFHAQNLGMSEKTVVESQNLNLNLNPPLKSLEGLDNDQLARLAEAATIIANLSGNRSGAGSPAQEQDPQLLPGLGTASAGTVPEAP